MIAPRISGFFSTVQQLYELDKNSQIKRRSSQISCDPQIDKGAKPILGVQIAPYSCGQDFIQYKLTCICVCFFPNRSAAVYGAPKGDLGGIFNVFYSFVFPL